MPYFVYRQSVDRKKLTQIEVFDKFKPAMLKCRELRQSQAPENNDSIRMVFAKDQKMAESLLSSKHKPSGPLEEWEA